MNYVDLIVTDEYGVLWRYCTWFYDPRAPDAKDQAREAEQRAKDKQKEVGGTIEHFHMNCDTLP